MKTIEVVAAIIRNNGEILCMQRDVNKLTYLSCKYEFPGGKIEPGETRTEALQREILEEMGIRISVDENHHFLSIDHTYPDFRIIMHSFICNVENKEFERKEHMNHQWLPPHQLRELDWAAADQPIVEKLVKCCGLRDLRDDQIG